MTENEKEIKVAIEHLKARNMSAKHIEMAIQALEEIQQYREIGTVEEIYNMLKVLNRTVSEIYSEVSKYQEIGTIEEFKALKEKSVAKKPTPIDYERYMGVIENAKFLRGAFWCPKCKHTVRSGTYCDDCGQKLDWGE